MSALNTTIEILLKGKDYASDAFKSAGGSASGLTDKLQSMTDPFANVADAALKAETAVLAIGAAFVGLSLKSAIKAETSLTELKKVLGDGEDDLEAYKKRVFEISDAFATSVPNVYESAAAFKQAGFDINQAFDLTEIALKAAKISELSVDEASLSLVTTLSKINGGVDESTKLIDLFNYAANSYKAGFGEIAEATARASGAFSVGQFSMEEMLAVIVQVNEGIRNGAITGTALNSSLAKLASDSKPVVETLDKLNVAQKNSNGTLRSTKDILFDLIPAISKYADTEKVAYLNKLFGIEQGPKLIGLFRDQEQVMTKINELQKEASGSANKEYQIAMDQTAEKLNALKNAFENVLGASGDQFLEEFGNVTDASKGLFNTLREEIEGGSFDDLFDVIKNNFTTLEESLNTITKNLPAALEQVDLKGLASSFDNVFDSASELLGFDFSTENGLAEGIQFLVDSIASLNNFSSGILDGLKPFFDLLREGADEFNDMDEAGQKFAGNIVGIGKGVNTLVGFLGPLLESLDAIGATFITLGSAKFIAMITGNTLTGGFQKAGQALSSFAGAAKNIPFGKLAGRLGIYGAAAYGGFEAGKKLAELADDAFPEFGNAMKRLDRRFREFVGIETFEDKMAFKNVDETLLKKLEEQVGKTIDSWEDYQEALKQVRQEADKIKETNRQVQTSINDINNKSVEYIERQQKNATANDGFSESARKAQERTQQLTEQMKKFTEDAKIEALKQEDIFKNIASTMEINVGGQIDVLEKLLNAGDNISNEASTEIQRFLNNSSEQTKAINEANVGLLTSQRELIDAQTEITRLKAEYGEIRVNADGLQPHLQAILTDLFKFIKIEAQGGNLLTGGQ